MLTCGLLGWTADTRCAVGEVAGRRRVVEGLQVPGGTVHGRHAVPAHAH